MIEMKNAKKHAKISLIECEKNIQWKLSQSFRFSDFENVFVNIFKVRLTKFV